MVFAASRGSGEAAGTNQGDDLQTENEEDEGYDSPVMFQRPIRVALDLVDLIDQVGNFFGRHFDCTPQLKSIDTRAIVKRAAHLVLHRSSSCTVTHSPILLSYCTIPFAQLVPTNRFRSGRSPPQRRRAVLTKFWHADGAQRIPPCDTTQSPRAATGSRTPGSRQFRLQLGSERDALGVYHRRHVAPRASPEISAPQILLREEHTVGGTQSPASLRSDIPAY